MDWEMIKSGNYKVTDDFVEKVEEECVSEGIFSYEWEIFCVRFGELIEEYEFCSDEFLTDVQEELEQYQSTASVLEMNEKEAYRFLNSIYLEGYREFKVMAREDVDVCFYGSSNIYIKEGDEDIFTFCDEYEYLSGRRFPPNRYKGKQKEIYNNIISEFCGYDGEIIDFIQNSGDIGEEEIFGDIKIRIFSKY